MVSLRDLVDYCDGFLRIGEIDDYANALNGLQLENGGSVTKIGAAVDASTPTMRKAVEEEANLLLVHHGLFWSGPRPVVGHVRGQFAFAFDHDLAIYSAHLPLDVHPEVGNNVLLARGLRLQNLAPFLEHKGKPIGVRSETRTARGDLVARLEKLLGGPVHCVGGGPLECRSIGIVSGGAGSDVEAAARAGVDTFITGEAPHWAAVAAEELGVNLLLGGHYATETFGVKALAAHLAERFGLPWIFVDHPTGL